jgi:NAD(P)-dependent dehydrogenase (short-subunit alcohol dehydrogenase family)
LVKNAYASHEEPLDELTEATWNEVLDFTLKGAFFCSQAAASRGSREKLFVTQGLQAC